MGFVEKLIYRLATWGAVVGAADIGFCTVLIVVGVITRAFGHTIPGTFDLVEIAIVLVGAYSFPFCETKDHHTKADVVINRLSSRSKSRLAVITTFLSLSFWSILLYAGWGMLKRMYEEGEETELLKINIVPFRALWVFALLLMCLILLFKWFHHIRDAFFSKSASKAAK
jgi:TRAP-type C4-dicarboxylate transport system permease small subunit